jgi:hypothetical protein
MPLLNKLSISGFKSIAKEIGIMTMRQQCPNFNRWVGRLASV